MTPADQSQGSSRVAREARLQTKCMCIRRVKSGHCVKCMNPKNTKKITYSWECGREHNLRFWSLWHQPFRSCQSITRPHTNIVHSLNCLQEIKKSGLCNDSIFFKKMHICKNNCMFSMTSSWNSGRWGFYNSISLDIQDRKPKLTILVILPRDMSIYSLSSYMLDRFQDFEGSFCPNKNFKFN